MTTVLVDSNVILDVISADPMWAGWSSTALASVGDDATLVINALVYAEVSVRFDTIDQIEAAVPRAMFRRDEIPYEAAFLAGKAFLKYRQRGGPRRSPLPDFFVGAHAAVMGYRLLTRDSRRYRSYFPTVDLIAPD